jgi:hypothetical protein
LRAQDVVGLGGLVLVAAVGALEKVVQLAAATFAPPPAAGVRWLDRPVGAALLVSER